MEHQPLEILYISALVVAGGAFVAHLITYRLTKKAARAYKVDRRKFSYGQRPVNRPNPQRQKDTPNFRLIDGGKK